MQGIPCKYAQFYLSIKKRAIIRKPRSAIMDTKTNGVLYNNMKSSWTVSDSTLQPAIHLYGFGVASRKISTVTEKPAKTLPAACWCESRVSSYIYHLKNGIVIYGMQRQICESGCLLKQDMKETCKNLKQHFYSSYFCLYWKISLFIK